jgi:hypothetical protein
MSTSKIYTIFGVFVVLITIPLIIFYVWFPQTLGRYTGLVEDAIVGLFGALVVTIALDFTLRRRQEIAMEKVGKVSLAQASQVINRFMNLFAEMVKASSDGFVPSTIEELFGKKSSELICLHLALGQNAPTQPKMPWKKYISREARSTKDGLSSILERYQAFISESVLAAIGTLQNNILLDILANLEQLPPPAIPVLNIQLDCLEQIMNEIVSSIKIVEREVKRLNTDPAIKFPNATFRTDINIGPKFGDSRFEGQPGPGIYIGTEPPSSWQQQ